MAAATVIVNTTNAAPLRGRKPSTSRVATAAILNSFTIAITPLTGTCAAYNELATSFAKVGGILSRFTQHSFPVKHCPRFSVNFFILLTLFLAACGNSAGSSTVAPPTYVQISPSPTERPSAPPTWTTMPEVRIQPMTVDELYGEKYIGEYDGLEHYDEGGYYIGEPVNIEGSVDEFLWMDFSHEGEIRITESDQLDSASWGVYLERVTYYYKSTQIPNQALIRTIYNQLYSNHRKLEVTWGDLKEGTGIRISNELLAYYSRKTNLSEEEILVSFGLSNEDGLFLRTEIPLAMSTKYGRVIDEPSILYIAQ